MTRGRDTNTAHLVAESLGDARDRAAAFSRDSADLGPAAAATRAADDAARHSAYRPAREREAAERLRLAAWEADQRRRPSRPGPRIGR